MTDTRLWHDGHLPLVDKDGTVIGPIRAYQSFVLRNTDMVKDNEITSFKDLLNAKWKGKMVLNDPSTPGAGASFASFLAVIWGEDQAYQFLRGLVDQQVVVARDWRQQVECGVARGKYPIAIAPNTDNITEFLMVGAPIQPVKAVEGGNEHHAKRFAPGIEVLFLQIITIVTFQVTDSADWFRHNLEFTGRCVHSLFIHIL